MIASILLSRANFHCTLIEKNHYPFHRVCGEYISNEALPFLKSLNLLPDIELPQITKFQLSSVKGKSALLPLDLGGFGISRHYFDDFLYHKAKSSGVHFLLDTIAETIEYSDSKFIVTTNGSVLEADLVIGAYGKRAKLDVKLNRSFIKKKSPYVAVKYHIKTDFPNDLITLHNFPGGYCGISNVENQVTNLCYLANRKYLRIFKNISDFEQNVLFQNPLLKYIFKNSDFLFDRPLTINEVSFATKKPVENHILMAGDAAGMIAPLCGNGMAMAIHSAKLLSEIIIQHCVKSSDPRIAIESCYERKWTQNFSKRIRLGRYLQQLFGNSMTSSLSVSMALYCKPLARILIKSSHGKTF